MLLLLLLARLAQDPTHLAHLARLALLPAPPALDLTPLALPILLVQPLVLGLAPLDPAQAQAQAVPLEAFDIDFAGMNRFL